MGSSESNNHDDSAPRPQSSRAAGVLNAVTFGLLRSRARTAQFEYLFSLICLAQLDEIEAHFESLDEARRTKLARDLLEQEDEEKANGMTLFMYAAYYAKPSICRYFLRFGPNPNHTDADQRTALFHAVRGESSECVEALLQGQKTATVVNRQTASTHTTALLEAVRRGQPEICRLLLSSGANPAIADIDAVTPLHVAADTMSVEIVRTMLDAASHLGKKEAALINSPDKWGWTPMHLAATRDDPALLKLLIGRGGSIHIQDKCGQTPLQWAQQTRAACAIQTLNKKATIQSTFSKKKQNSATTKKTVRFQEGFSLNELQDLSFS